MIKAFPWKSRESSKAVQGQPPAPASPPVLPEETAGRVYGADLNRIEAKLNSLFAAVTAAAKAQPVNFPASVPRRPSLGVTIADISRRQQELDSLHAATYVPPESAFVQQSNEDRMRPMSLITLQNDIAGLSARLDAMQREQIVRFAATTPTCNLDKLRSEIAAMSEALHGVASRGSVATVESAIRGLSQKIEDSRNGGTRDAILRPMEELVAELRQSLAEIDPRMTIQGLESEVSKLGLKIDDLGRSRVDPATFGHIQAQTREIRDLLSAATARPLPVERIERQVAELAQSLGEQRAVPRENFASVRPDPAQFSTIEARLGQIAAKVEESLSVARDQSRYDDLSNRIDYFHEGLSARIADLRPRAPDTRALEDLLRPLSDKIERVATQQTNQDAIEALERSVGELFGEFERTQTASLEAAERNAAHEQSRYEDLSSRIDNFHGGISARIAEVQSAADTSALEERIGHLAQQVETSNPTLSLNALERSVGELFSEFERTRAASLEAAELNAAHDQIRYEDLSSRIDNFHEGLSARIAELPSLAPDTSALEGMVHSLSEKIERVMVQQADHHAIEALEEQISQLARQMETSNSGASLNALERTVSELFSEFERTRTGNLEAAEQSARNAVREALSDVPDHAAERAKIAGELGELRDRQVQADQRTLSTLNAVHETLEKVVERLSTFESELTERRSAPNDLPPPPYIPTPASPPPPSSVERHNPRPPEPPIGATEDFLIEPGSGYRGRKDNGNSTGRPPALPDAPDTSTSRSDFIAAARRAAQAAQRETTAASVLSQARPAPVHVGESKSGLLQGTRMIFAHYRRPVALSLAAIFVAIGTYAVLKSLGHPPTKTSRLDPPAAVASANPPSSSFTAPQAPVVTMNGPVQADDSALSPNSIGTPAASPSMTGADSMATGSIVRPPAFQASGPHDISLADLSGAARGGSALAQFALAANYADGRVLPRDMKIAAQWYEAAANQGFAPAQYRLASFYEKGIGVARDADKARALYHQAALQGNVRAMHNLAVLAADGGDSGRPDYALAARWFKQAADYGVRDSQYNYAVLLARGMGVPQDFVASYVWFDLAAKQGDQDSARKRDDVGARLSPAQLATAKATAAAFISRTPSASANDVVLPVISPNAKPSSLEVPLTFGQRPKVSML